MRRFFTFMSIVLIIAISAPDIDARSFYNSASNNFGGLFPHPGMRMRGRYKDIKDGCLIEENATMATAITIDTMFITSPSYRYQLRMANLNNKQGKNRSISNPMTGEKTTLTSTQWGLLFNFDANADYYAVVLSCDNSDPYNDIADQRTMQITLVKCSGGDKVELARATISRGVSLEDEMNTLCVDVDEREVTVSIGKNELQEVLHAKVPRSMATVQVGYLVGPGARVSIERAVLTVENDKQVDNHTSWTRETLDQYLEETIDPIEGYWRYLDRDTQDEWLRLGGRYTLAIVKSGDNYDIIYIDGAQVKKSLWQTGMLKGHMAKTAFSGNYDLSWIDATAEPIGGEAYASVDGIILSLNFPEYKSQVRFAKVIDSQ